MARGGRFCINCGDEIGDAVVCRNPKCGHLPNLYREVPAPEHRKESPSGETPNSPPGRPPPKTPSESMTIPIAGAAQPAPEAAPAGAPVGFLSSLDGSGKQYPLLPGTNEIGARPPAAIVLSRPEVSSRHASIDCRREADGLWRITLLDRGSTNGTYVNGKRVTSRELRGGDRIAFAKPEYAYELRIPAAAGDERFTMRVR